MSSSAADGHPNDAIANSRTSVPRHLHFRDDVSRCGRHGHRPARRNDQEQYFTSTVSSYFRGNIAKVSIDLATLSSHVDAADTGKYAEDLRATNKAIGGYFAVGKSFIKSTDEAGKAEFRNGFASSSRN